MGIGSCDERRGVRGAQPLPQWAVGGAVVLWIYRAWLIVFCDIVGGYSLQIFRSLGVESGLCGVDYKLAEYPFVYLILRALLCLAERDAQGFKLSLVERVGQVV